MKNYLVILLLLSIVSCENQEIVFDDFDYTTAYFPYQYPVRTLVLGDYIYDNSNDNNHKFLISAAMGGVYENPKDRELKIEIDESLCEDVLFSPSEDTIRVMPSNYYSLSSSETILIPKGKVNGSIEVQLTEAFFEDSLAIKLGYVIPVRIIGSTDVDSILQGKSDFSNPDPRMAESWTILPKDFTMFAVKYINPYHGNYLHKGVSVVADASGDEVETTIYSEKFITRNEIWSLITESRNEVAVEGIIRSSYISGSIKMILSFSSDGNCVVREASDSDFVISGSGKFMQNTEEWGNKKRNAIYLNYSLSNDVYTYNAVDTLVIRDRNVVMELYNPLLKE
ncbi:DUF5627 domain-containing protein [Mariniphaga sediminis]|jgi:hypothetical protein|uniref:DUF5627 domain-containing protein n=1 Tax=Mariniphaga sediminis TaxID=1628158 RepID=UPI003563653E